MRYVVRKERAAWIVRDVHGQFMAGRRTHAAAIHWADTLATYAHRTRFQRDLERTRKALSRMERLTKRAQGHSHARKVNAMTNRYIVNGLISDMLDGKDILAIGAPLSLVTHLVDRVEKELRARNMDDWIETSSRCNGDRHITLADLGSIRALSARSDTALRGRTADICAFYRNGLDHYPILCLLDSMKAVITTSDAGEIIPLD